VTRQQAGGHYLATTSSSRHAVAEVQVSNGACGLEGLLVGFLDDRVSTTVCLLLTYNIHTNGASARRRQRLSTPGAGGCVTYADIWCRMRYVRRTDAACVCFQGRAGLCGVPCGKDATVCHCVIARQRSHARTLHSSGHPCNPPLLHGSADSGWLVQAHGGMPISPRTACTRVGGRHPGEAGTTTSRIVAACCSEDAELALQYQASRPILQHKGKPASSKSCRALNKQRVN
jgi:hypothetical protein